MTKPNEKLAEALKALKKIQGKYSGVVESRDLKDAHRIILLDEGFLRQVMKGWYVCSSPRDKDGDSTAWYACFWSFLAGYLNKRFGKQYCLNVEASILLHTHSTVIPRQITVMTKKGGTSVLNLPHDTSVLLYADNKNFPATRTETNNLQVIPLAEALCSIGPRFFKNHPREAEIALRLVRDPGDLLKVLLDGDGMPSAAARLAGALRFMGRDMDADRIVDTMRRAKQNIQEINPFEIPKPTLGNSRERSPYAMRIESMWLGWREDILSIFPSPPGLPMTPENYLTQVDERYVADAYNSLSIEGYQVTDALIERVAKGDWSPDEDERDKNNRDALAARGYFQAFQAVKTSLSAILSGDNAGEIARRAHHQWYGELFAPSVTAGIVATHQLAGYRSGPIYIRNSMHTPLPREALTDAMEMLFNLIAQEPEAAVRAVLGHHLFVFIHPYFDGNGRMGRFLMNSMLASGGYPWTIIRMKSRREYMRALETASVDDDIKPFAQFIVQEMHAWEAA